MTQDTQETMDKMLAEIRKTKMLTDNPFGLNVIFMGSKDDALDDFTFSWLDMTIQEGVRFFVSVGNANKNVFKVIKESSGIIIYRLLTPSIANMQEAEAMGADPLVATGVDEGGAHLREHLELLQLYQLWLML
jgi:NAD(P)H-dependent flavin oxidoreductase YrpB (nitropropane dioxygenase family)